MHFSLGRLGRCRSTGCAGATEERGDNRNGKQGDKDCFHLS